MIAGLSFSLHRSEKQAPRRHLTPCVLFALGLAWASVGHAQGPGVEYYYNSDSTLEWAACAVTLDGGSRLRVPFLPVVLTRPVQAPVGTGKYADDVSVNAPLAFVGDGNVADSWDAYSHTDAWVRGAIDVEGKAAFICYDCTNSYVAEDSPSASLAGRVQAAASRGAVAAVLFSVEKEAPFLLLESSEAPSPEIPVITVSRTTAAAILDAAGPGGELLDRLASSPAEPPTSKDLIVRLQLRIDGAFDRLETDNFLFLFRASRIDRERVTAAAYVHEAALEGIKSKIGGVDDSPWPRATTVYFGGFDSKLFFTHHWGSGLSNSAGAFLRWDGAEADAGLIAHEHTHTYTALNWGNSSSFMNEGVARYVEAELTDASMNHHETRCLLDRDELPPLRDMLYIDVGADELTPVAYPAAGSLVGYLLETGGMKTLRRVFELEGRTLDDKRARDTWEQVLSKSLAEVDQGWRSWLKRLKLESDCSP